MASAARNIRGEFFAYGARGEGTVGEAVGAPVSPRFAVDVYQNEQLPEGERRVDAIVTVTFEGAREQPRAAAPNAPSAPGRDGEGADGAETAVVIMVDCSRSMEHPLGKMLSARAATAAATEALRDGARFAVVAGDHRAREVYPGGGRLAVAGDRTRAEAVRAVNGLAGDGGTAIGAWLRLADRLLATSGAAAVRHGILLTDGRNEHEDPELLRETLEECAGRFTCDARGVGTDWEVEEVAGIASALLGSADIVAEPEDLAGDFERLMRKAMRKEVAGAALRLWTPRDVEVVFVKQVAPTVEDVTDRRAADGPRSGDYPTGSWSEGESRDYHVCVRVPAAEAGQEMLAARASMALPAAGGGLPDRLPGKVSAQGLVRAVWTGDVAVATAIDARVAHYTGQQELARSVRRGLAARRAGDRAGAVADLGRAVRLAGEFGNADTAKLLSKVVDVLDASTGTVRLRTQVADADAMALETRATRTVRVEKYTP